MDIKTFINKLNEGKDQLGRNQLHKAVQEKDIKKVKDLMVKHPEYIKEKDNFGKTPKDYAKEEILKVLEK